MFPFPKHPNFALFDNSTRKTKLLAGLSERSVFVSMNLMRCYDGSGLVHLRCYHVWGMRSFGYHQRQTCLVHFTVRMTEGVMLVLIFMMTLIGEPFFGVKILCYLVTTCGLRPARYYWAWQEQTSWCFNFSSLQIDKSSCHCWQSFDLGSEVREKGKKSQFSGIRLDYSGYRSGLQHYALIGTVLLITPLILVNSCSLKRKEIQLPLERCQDESFSCR